jgi:predicted RNase H-like HicB family nuclease
MKLRVVIEFDEQADAYSATCPELNFVSSCGKTKEQAIANLQEAVHLMLTPLPALEDYFEKHQEKLEDFIFYLGCKERKENLELVGSEVLFKSLKERL